MSRRHLATCLTCHETCQADRHLGPSGDMSCLRHYQHRLSLPDGLLLYVWLALIISVVDLGGTDLGECGMLIGVHSKMIEKEM